MKHLTIALSVFLVTLSLPVLSLGAEHGETAATDPAMEHHHDGMAAEGGMFILGEMTKEGVRAMAHLKDVTTAMQAMGMSTTHHFMVAFADEETGSLIETGVVALKIERPDGTVDGPLELAGMEGHFGADIVLAREGDYAFELGTRLADGITRSYRFEFDRTDH